jgi:hypothetical protein
MGFKPPYLTVTTSKFAKKKTKEDKNLLTDYIRRFIKKVSSLNLD